MDGPVDTGQILLSVGGGLIVLILGFALNNLVAAVGKRIDELSAGLGARMGNVESRLNGMDVSLGTIQKDLGEVAGWVRAHGPLADPHPPLAPEG